ncbi:MAG: ribonuclease T [Gammaproteobacteria bacterium]|nr:ribonuclease T [Gammaproteobacteria bacterium]
MSKPHPPMARRFRGYLPVVVDLETGGFDALKNPVLEIGAVALLMSEDGQLKPGEAFHYHVEPYPGLYIEPAALEFTGIDPNHPFRFAVSERDALSELFGNLRRLMKEAGCQRCVLVGHNAWFDLSFLRAAVERSEIKRAPFHSFTSFDTATLGGLAFGQTVLAKACQAAGIAFDNREAHSALYDAERTAELFCQIVNRWNALGGWPPPLPLPDGGDNDPE